MNICELQLLKVVARTCGHNHINQFHFDDISTFNWNIRKVIGILFTGTNP